MSIRELRKRVRVELPAKNLVTIERYRSGALCAITAFVRGWTYEDRYARFRSTGDACVSWLIEQLARGSNHRALIARDGGRHVGLLDYVLTADGIDFGIFVQSEYRRMRIGARLVRALIDLKSPGKRIVAQCCLENGAAVGLLRSCNFVPAAMWHGEIDWEYR